MDVDCLGPFQSCYKQICSSIARYNHHVATRYDVCAFACKAYVTAHCPSNLHSSFKKVVIYPLLTANDMCEYLGNEIMPATLYDPHSDQALKSYVPSFLKTQRYCH